MTAYFICLFNEIKTIFYLLFRPIRGRNHQERLECFYKNQETFYDSYRQKLLRTREILLDHIPIGGIWIDMGCGTGFNLQYLFEKDKLKDFEKIYLVDLSPSLLRICKQRIEDHQWKNVEIIEDDVTKWKLKDEKADLITFSYSLTMIPDWFLAVENAKDLLKTNGLIGVTDFYISRKYPSDGFQFHCWFVRMFWMIFFAFDNVNLCWDHLPFLHSHFKSKFIVEKLSSIPYIPFLKVPQYVYLGEKMSF